MTKILSNEYTAKKGNVALYMFRKRLAKSADSQPESQPIVFLVPAVVAVIELPTPNLPG